LQRPLICRLQYATVIVNAHEIAKRQPNLMMRVEIVGQVLKHRWHQAIVSIEKQEVLAVERASGVASVSGSANAAVRLPHQTDAAIRVGNERDDVHRVVG